MHQIKTVEIPVFYEYNNTNLWAIFGITLISKLHTIQCLESGSIPILQEWYHTPTKIWNIKQFKTIYNTKQSRASREQWSKTHRKSDNIWYKHYKKTA